MLELVCATSNEHKLLEFQRAGRGIRIRGCAPLDCPETGDTFEANALQKALCYAAAEQPEWLFADDSGLEVDALGGAPGILSARYAGEDCDDLENNRLLLRRLQDVPREQRTARFVCAIALVRHGAHVATFRGEVEGRILRRHSGRGGFGYDPLFHYPPLGTSFGRLPREIKWLHSHRREAYRAMLAWLGKHGHTPAVPGV